MDMGRAWTKPYDFIPSSKVSLTDILGLNISFMIAGCHLPAKSSAILKNWSLLSRSASHHTTARQARFFPHVLSGGK